MRSPSALHEVLLCTLMYMSVRGQPGTPDENRSTVMACGRMSGDCRALRVEMEAHEQQRMVAQVRADARQVLPHRDAVLAQVRGRADAGSASAWPTNGCRRG